MKTKSLLLVPLSVLLVACGPNKIISDLPSPSGLYHAEVRKCPQNGASLERTEKTQVSILKSGLSEHCESFINALVQFEGYAPDDQLQLEWLSDGELRAWHPGFTLNNGPMTATVKQNSPVNVIFSPKQ